MLYIPQLIVEILLSEIKIQEKWKQEQLKKKYEDN